MKSFSTYTLESAISHHLVCQLDPEGEHHVWHDASTGEPVMTSRMARDEHNWKRGYRDYNLVASWHPYQRELHPDLPEGPFYSRPWSGGPKQHQWALTDSYTHMLRTGETVTR